MTILVRNMPSRVYCKAYSVHEWGECVMDQGAVFNRVQISRFTCAVPWSVTQNELRSLGVIDRTCGDTSVFFNRYFKTCGS